MTKLTLTEQEELFAKDCMLINYFMNTADLPTMKSGLL